MYWDFGSGQIGDMGSHTMDLAWNAIDAGLPTSAEATGEPFNPEVTPVELTATFEHPANDWRRPITRHLVPGRRHAASRRATYIDLNKIGHGAMFKGTRASSIADFDTRVLLPLRRHGRHDLLQAAPRREPDPAAGPLPEGVDQRLQGRPEDLLRLRLQRHT